MSLRPKAEIAEIREHLAALKSASWLGSARSWWPSFVFHCTDVRNVVSILNSGELLSRIQGEKSGSLQADIAAPEIIARTNPQWQDYVRLYFRPRTPTQYNNEGFRPKGQWSYNSHCPIPVYLLFDAQVVLSRADSLFTEGNLASGAQPNSSVDYLRQIPFQMVYHDTGFGPAEQAPIVYRRNAEVLVPQRLGLESLRWIICRSQAEYETLLYLLPPGANARWVSMIGVLPNLRLFNSHWTFVQQVEMSSERLLFRFNQRTRTPGPFDALVESSEIQTGLKYTWHEKQFQADDVLNLNLSSLKNSQDYVARLSLDDHLAFASRYQQDDLPF